MRLAVGLAGGLAAWAAWSLAGDEQRGFRVAVALAIALIALLRPAEQEPPLEAVFVVLVALFVPVVGPALGLGIGAFWVTRRWPVVILALLVLPLDPWFATSVRWPLQVITAGLGGLLSFDWPLFDGATVYLDVDCTSFCSDPSHLGTEPFRINDKCAGLAQIEAMLALTSAMLLLLVRRPILRRAVFFVALAPVLAIVLNGVRIACSVWIGRAVGRGPWEGWIHDLPGLVCTAVFVFVLARNMGWFEGDRDVPE
jgi:exosortase/archaeosortase family protein